MADDARRAVLDVIAGAVRRVDGAAITRVGVDGVDGAGKTVFADALAAVLGEDGTEVIRASVDGFHHPPQVRYRQGRQSPEGFYADSYDYAALASRLLEPLGPGGDGRYVRAVYDVAAEQPVDATEEVATAGGILVFDGIFLHRPELQGFWDYSVLLEVGFDEAYRRMAGRDGCDPDPVSPSNRRYVEGQRRYLAAVEPQRLADVVVDNTDPASPRIVARGVTEPAAARPGIR